ncbi:SMI1/KNR4 family protein [Eubacterium ramulus]
MNLKNLEYIEKKDPATKEEIDFAENRINGVLPKVYKEFLRYANGMIMNLCILYDTQRIVESYECNEFAEYAPGYISIGNDNGDRELIIKAENGAVLCGFLDAAEIGSSEPEEWFNFKSWVENGCEMDEEDDTEYGNVYITKLPDEKLKFLAETKKIFALSISTGVLYKQVNTLPCVIVQQITESKADILIQKTSYPECYKFGK